MPVKHRALSNTPVRRDIRPDFPSVKIYRPDDTANSQRLLDVIAQELAKQGETLESVGHITIAYPHKHPEMFPDHQNRATHHVAQFIQAMLDVAPGIDWKVADGICETRKLNRSKDQTCVHALAQRQEYAVFEPAQREPLPFLDAENGRREFFIVVDDAVLQGTTVANLMSFIEHNGGSVLMVSARESNDGVPIAPRRSTDSRFGGELSQNRFAEMAEVFSASAQSEGQAWTPAACLDKFEASLKKHGLSLNSITDGECVSLIDTIQGRNRRADTGPAVSFTGILTQLEQAAMPAPARNAAPAHKTAAGGPTA